VDGEDIGELERMMKELTLHA